MKIQLQQVRWLARNWFFSTFHLSSTRTNQRTCCEPAACRFTTRFSTERSKAGRKLAANPHELVENLVANLVENQVCSWLEQWNVALSGFEIDVWWRDECRQQFRPWSKFIAQSVGFHLEANGHAKTPRFSESSQESCSIVDKLLWSKYQYAV